MTKTLSFITAKTHSPITMKIVTSYMYVKFPLLIFLLYFIIRIYFQKFLNFYSRSHEGHGIIGHWMRLDLNYYIIIIKIYSPIKKNIDNVICYNF